MSHTGGRACGNTIAHELLGGGGFSAPVQTGLGDPPSLLYSGYRVIPGGKAAGA